MDYKLYPIPLKDINRPVYYMVKTALGQKFKILPEGSLQEEWLQLHEDIGKGDLVFPSADYTQTYDSKTLKLEVIIVTSQSESFSYITVDGKRIPYKPVPKVKKEEEYESPFYSGWVGYDDDDEEIEEEPGPKVEWETVYHETHYSIGVNPKTGRYQVVTSTDDFTYYPPYPRPRYNWEEVVEAIDRLLPVVAGAYLSRGKWAERLEVTRNMLVEKANELHILHNGGLYDNHVLARLLADSVLQPDVWQPLFKEYVESLKRFAMCAVTLPWGSDSSTSLKIFLKQNKIVPERERQTIEKEHLRRKGTITDTDVLKPVSKPKWLELYEQEEKEKPHAPEVIEKPQKPETIHYTGLYCPPLPDYVPEIPAAESSKVEKVSFSTESFSRKSYSLDSAGKESAGKESVSRKSVSRKSVSKEQQRADHNAAIRRRVFWFLLGALVFVAVIMFAKYSITGAATVSVGLITGIIMRNVNRLMQDYDYSDSHPRWFTVSMVFLALFGTLAGIVGCKMLADYIYEASGGSVTPWDIFSLVAAISGIVFIYSLILYKSSWGSRRRFYIFLMVLSAVLFLSQCTGSLSSSKQTEHTEWIRSMEK